MKTIVLVYGFFLQSQTPYVDSQLHFILQLLKGPDPISCRKWDVSYFTTLKKKITNVAFAAIYSNNTLTNDCWKQLWHILRLK